MNFSIGRWLLFCLVGATLLSCNKLIDVNNIEPVNQLSEDQAITNVKQAQTVLYGTYGILKTNSAILSYNPGLTAMRGLTMVPGSFAGPDEAAFYNNEVPSDSYYVDLIYTTLYSVINNANHIIEKTPLIQSDDPRKEQIIGEARFLRALSHFYLLRLHGYFFDVSSKYGVVIKDHPIKDASPEPRAAVQAVYDFINADLDYAIAHCASFTNTLYASAEAAMGLKAKVLLYEKKYEEAATLAKQVIESGKFHLETTFSTIFFKKIVDPKEVLFQLPYDEKNDRNNKAFMFRAYFLPSPYYKQILAGDNRDTAALTTTTTGALRNKKFNGTIFNGQTLTADTEYFLRLDEVYLILAEALSRSNSDLQDAVDAVNVIRQRVEMPDIAVTTKADVLEKIRVEKILELGCESGEEWYDLVRYASEGDLTVSDFKSSVTNETKYVLPLPYNTVKLSNGIVEQNPGY